MIAQKEEIMKQAWLGTPSLAAFITYMLGVPMNTWVGIASISYCALQAAYLIWKWKREAKTK